MKPNNLKNNQRKWYFFSKYSKAHEEYNFIQIQVVFHNRKGKTIRSFLFPVSFRHFTTPYSSSPISMQESSLFIRHIQRAAPAASDPGGAPP